MGFLINFIFCRLAETTVSGSPSVMWLLEVTSVWGVSVVAILDSSVNCVCAGYDNNFFSNLGQVDEFSTCPSCKTSLPMPDS